jgi:hypothetical protein
MGKVSSISIVILFSLNLYNCNKIEDFRVQTIDLDWENAGLKRKIEDLEDDVSSLRGDVDELQMEVSNLDRY